MKALHLNVQAAEVQASRCHWLCKTPTAGWLGRPAANLQSLP